LEIRGTRLQCEVVFSEQPIPRELLGRHTFLPQVRRGFVKAIRLVFSIPTREISCGQCGGGVGTVVTATGRCSPQRQRCAPHYGIPSASS
jgi:hypothetical protein